ncbi:MAG: hypothetical protein K0S44_742 [Bacteroidetes bacterium]|jgi:hypothetical protein|nr:hypothetical protein [Bacteroidota bacterium]
MNPNITDNNFNEGPGPSFGEGNKNPFRTEADYFENFAESISGKIEIHEELKNEAPLLSSIPKYNPFITPKGYFDELPSSVQEKCLITTSGYSFFEILKLIFRPNFAIPVVLVIVLAFTAIRYIDNDPIEKVVAQELNIDDHLLNIDESVIIEALASASTKEMEMDPENELIKDYLLDNNIEEDLNNEL